MRFTLFVDSRTWLGWSDVSGQPQVFGTPELVKRLRRAEFLGRGISGFPADLSRPHRAYKVMVACMRERVQHQGLIEFMGYDDDGLEIAFVPEPDAETPATIPQGG